jgi:hypothetical protein
MKWTSRPANINMVHHFSADVEEPYSSRRRQTGLIQAKEEEYKAEEINIIIYLEKRVQRQISKYQTQKIFTNQNFNKTLKRSGHAESK